MEEQYISSIDKRRLIVDKRRSTCNSCEHLKIIIGAKFCNLCGCNIWAKTMIKSQSCPEGKWDVEKN